MGELDRRTTNPGISVARETLLQIIGLQTDIVRLGRSFDRVVGLVAERLMQLTGGGGATVELADGDEMVYRAVAGMAGRHLGYRMKQEPSLSGLALRLGQVLYCEDSETDPRVSPEACRNVGVRSLVAAPLIHNGRAVGALKIVSARPGGFSQAHIEVLQLMSDLVAAAMFHAANYGVDELVYRATHDALTGLANRSLYFERLRARLEEAEREGGRFGLLNIDMDGLKQINDEYGHQAGDAALRETALRLKHASREDDTVARLGGDEFAVLLPRIEEAGIAARLGERIGEALEAPFRYKGQPIWLGASVGVATYPETGTDLDTLTEAADAAMYQVKRTRKRRTRGFADDPMDFTGPLF